MLRSLLFSAVTTPPTLALHHPFSTTTTTTLTGVSLYLHRARQINSLRLLLRSHPPSSPIPLPSPLDPFVALHALRSAPSPSLAQSLFFSLPPPLPSSPPLLLSLAKRLPLPSLRSLLSSSPPFSPLDRLRLLSSAGDAPSSLSLFSSLRSAAKSSHLHLSTEHYNLILSLHANASSHSAAIDTFHQMISDGAIPNSRTYTVIIEHLIRYGKVDSAVELFDLLPSMRIRRTTKQYDAIAEALSSDAFFGKMRMLIREMNSDGILPGRRMRAVMAKMRELGLKDETEEFARELEPDERIGYAVGETGESDDDEGDDDSGGDHGSVRLKPWMDPAALAKALDGWDRAEVKELEKTGFVWTTRMVCKLLRGFKKPETAWQFFCWVSHQPGDFAHDRYTVSRMIAILAKAGHVELVDRLLAKLKAETIPLPFDTVRLAVDFYGLSKKPEAATKLYRNADSICGGTLSKHHRLLLCSSLLRTVVKCRRNKPHEVMELVEEILSSGVRLDVQTFSGLMQYFAGEGDLKSVHRLFGIMRQCGVEPDGYTFRVLIRAYCKNERAALALRVFEEMRGVGLVPDIGTKNFLVKSLWKEGKLREAATVEERCEGLSEEEIPAALPGHVWTVSVKDFKRVCEIYSSSFESSKGVRSNA